MVRAKELLKEAMTLENADQVKEFMEQALVEAGGQRLLRPVVGEAV